MNNTPQESQPLNQPQSSSPPSNQLDADVLALLNRPDLRDCFLRDVERLGCVGEEANKQLLYLAFTSRLLDNPISVIVRGESSSGKSRQVLSVASFFPRDAVLDLSSVSAKALNHYKGSLAHKVLLVMERAGAETAEYAIRTLQSEGKLDHLVTIKNSAGEFEAKRQHVEGPVSFIVTTTPDVVVDSQNENRCFVIHADESEEQTRRILEAQRGRYLGRGGDSLPRLDVWCRAQELLEPLPVRIPFAHLIEFPVTPLRVRREQPRFLALIETSAILHQFQRQIITQESEKYIEATPADYSLAYEMARNHLPGLIGALSPKAEELLKVIGVHCEPKKQFTMNDLQEWLKWDRKTVIKYREEATKAGYIEVVSENPGVLALFQLAKNHEKGRLLILSPGELRQKLEVSDRLGSPPEPTETPDGQVNPQ